MASSAASASTRVSLGHRVPSLSTSDKDPIRMLSLLVNLRPSVPSVPSQERSDSFGIAAWNNHCEEVQNLCRHGRDLNVLDDTGNTALFTAVWNGCISCVEKLVQAGADCCVVDRYDNSALMLAAELAYVQVTEKLLLAQVPINHQNYRGETALHKAASSSYVPCVRLLLRHGADPNIADDNHARPLLRCISRNRNPSAFVNMVLLIKSNAELDAEGRDVDGGRIVSPFQLAVCLGRLTAVRLLAVAGCNLRIMRKWIKDDDIPASLKKDLSLCNYLEESCSGPLQLRQTCRKVIRYHCDPNQLHHLGLPTALIDFLSFKDLDFIYDQD